MRRLPASIGVACGLAAPAPAHPYVECGNPRGPAKNVTATNVGCGDARACARKVARRRIARSQWITLGDGVACET